jgi:hypothetical protein
LLAVIWKKTTKVLVFERKFGWQIKMVDFYLRLIKQLVKHLYNLKNWNQSKRNFIFSLFVRRNPP